MKLSEIQKNFVVAMAKHDMNTSKVAREAHYHRNTVEYHLNRVHKETGLNPIWTGVLSNDGWAANPWVRVVEFERISRGEAIKNGM